MLLTRAFLPFIFANFAASDFLSDLNISSVLSPNETSPPKTKLPQIQSLAARIEEFEYEFPNTFRFVPIVIDKDAPLNPSAFHRVIATVLSQLRSHIIHHGDGRLEPGHNPYVFGIPGCSPKTESSRWHGAYKLTYGILVKTFDGLKIFLDEQRRWYEAEYIIQDDYGVIYEEGFIDDRNYDLNSTSLAMGGEG